MTHKRIVECYGCGRQITKENFDEQECVYVDDELRVFCGTTCLTNNTEVPDTFEELLDFVAED